MISVICADYTEFIELHFCVKLLCACAFFFTIYECNMCNIVGLKKVTSDMQTHKNPALRSGPAPFKAPTATNTATIKSVPPANVPIDKPPVFTRDGKKWLVVGE